MQGATHEMSPASTCKCSGMPEILPEVTVHAAGGCKTRSMHPNSRQVLSKRQTIGVDILKNIDTH